MKLKIPIALLYALATLLFYVRVSHAQEAPAEGAEAGKILAQDLITRVPVENSKWSGTMKIFRKDLPMLIVPVTCETQVMTDHWSVVYQTPGIGDIPSEKLTVSFSKGTAPTYFFQKGIAPGGELGEEKRMAGSEANIAFAGSDFWCSDLAFEFFHWPNQNRHKGEMRRGRPCYVMESTNDHKTADGYSRIKTWIEKESGAPMEAEAYGADNKLTKDFELGSVSKINGRYQVKNLKMYDRRKGSHTILEFDLDGK
jgi:hypothetical protein